MVDLQDFDFDDIKIQLKKTFIDQKAQFVWSLLSQ
jgi:hypothetical protein